MASAIRAYRGHGAVGRTYAPKNHHVRSFIAQERFVMRHPQEQADEPFCGPDALLAQLLFLQAIHLIKISQPEV
jgi:hypothetical protein